MRVDIHVHTGKYSGCAVDTPETMVEGAIAAGLDGIVLSEHDLVWPSTLLADLQLRYPQIRLFSGAEMTTLEGEHVLALGLDSFGGQPGHGPECN
jgi:predicted metal-dependent phosphoesterase TrpH